MRTIAALLLAGLSALSLHADQRPHLVVTALEVNELGHPIVQVTLAAMKPTVPDRTFRFLFDTGAGVTVLDTSVPPDFFWEASGGSLSLVDGTQRKVSSQTVHLKRLVLGGRTLDDLAAVRVDLKGTFLGQLQDKPVDGILGMNALKGTQFVMDLERKELRWWQGLEGHSLPLGYNPSGCPTFDITLSNTTVPCMVDTGATGGFQVPGEAGGSPDPEQTFYYASMAGSILEGRTFRVPRIPAGDRAWSDVDLDVVKPGEGTPQVGLTVLAAAPVAYDFLHNRITFTARSDGSLPYRKEPRRISLAWGSRTGERFLTIQPLRPASAYFKAGLRTGDHVLKVGPFEGETLSIKAVRDYLDKGEPHTWSVRRGAERVEVSVPAIR